MPLHVHRNGVPAGVRDELERILRHDDANEDLADALAEYTMSRGLRRPPSRRRGGLR